MSSNPSQPCSTTNPVSDKNGFIFQPEWETMPRADLERLQIQRLTALFERLRTSVPLYAERFAGHATPTRLEAFRETPFSHKADLRDSYPLGMCAVPVDRLARIHASSGTTGNPTVGAYTKRDLDIWGDVCARSLAMAGVFPGELFQVCWGYGLFTGGLGMHGGAERLGAAVVPASSGNTVRQLQLLEALPVVGIGATPSYALLLAERLRAEKRRASALRIAVCGAEAWTKEMRSELEEQLGVVATNIYGLTEIIGPGVSQECAHGKAGLHVQEDHFLCEIIDPKTETPLPDGQRGELVLTTLTREALPVWRYRTGDLTSLTRERCVCGRTTARMEWLTGRVDDMLIIRGVNVFPTAIEQALLEFDELSPNYRLIVERPPGELDVLTVEIEHRADVQEIGDLGARVSRHLSDVLAIAVVTRILLPQTIERVEAGKVRRVFDRRGV